MMPPMSDHDTWNMFAAAAMQGMLASPHLADHIKNVGSPPTTMDTYDYVAIAARAYADALLAESKKRETPDEPNLLETLEMFGMDDRAYVVGNEIRIPFDNHEDACRVVFKARTDLAAYRIVSEAGVAK